MGGLGAMQTVPAFKNELHRALRPRPHHHIMPCSLTTPEGPGAYVTASPSSTSPAAFLWQLMMPSGSWQSCIQHRGGQSGAAGTK